LKPAEPSFASAGISSHRRWSASASGLPPARKAPFISIAIARGCATTASLARDLLETVGVAATPGLDFGSNAPEKHIRFAYTTSVDRLAEAAERLGRYFARQA
jgi:aspartate/methionine/tyrosine aminotransferase